MNSIKKRAFVSAGPYAYLGYDRRPCAWRWLYEAKG